MEDFIMTIGVLILIGVSAVVKTKMKAARSTKEYSQAQGRWQQELKTEEAQQAAKPQEATRAWPAAPVPARMNGERLDDCHAYMLEDTAPAAAADEKTEEEKQQAANDLIRGVIISEILNRPRMGYGRRRA